MFKIRALANSGELRVNALNGALGAIKRVQFSVGDFILNDVDACAKWATLNGMMTKDRATQNRVDSHYLGNQFYSFLHKSSWLKNDHIHMAVGNFFFEGECECIKVQNGKKAL